jgi:amino acid adenylation domain-containing protein/non-ribosomal peptide synthase protein (TIGR01720 family)
MNDLTERIAGLSPERRRLIERLLRQEGVDLRRLPIVRQPRRDQPFPTSFAQQRLWFLDQFEPGSPFYNIPLAVRLQGQLDIPALRRALDEIVRRHDILRTTFPAMEGQPVQHVASALELPLEDIDLRHLAAEARWSEARRLAREEAQRPFDLRAGPLVRAALLRLTDDDHLALLTLHHIIADGWSMGVLLHELATLYAAFVAGRPASLPDLPIQYADYAVWQRETLARSAGDGVSPLDRQLAYWRERLADAPAALDLPTDRPRPPVQSSRGASCSARLPQALAERLRALGRQAGATLFMTLEAAFAVLLRRYSGQEEVCIGTPVAGRSRPELEGLIGCFINTLVLRHDLRGSPTFREVLERTRATALEAFAHQEAPFELVVEAVQAARDISRTPLFQVMFALQNAPVRVHHLPGVTLTQVEVDMGTSTFDLTLSATEDVEGVALAVEYCTDLFTEGTIHRLLTHYRVLLEGIVADPACPIDRLPLLSEWERRQVLVEWNRTEAPLPDRCVHELFERRVQDTPDAVAVIHDNRRLTYRELNRYANSLAHRLRHAGVGPEIVVATICTRSVELVTALLASLKSGGVFLPIDPTVPATRLRYMLSDARPALVVTNQGAMMPELSAVCDELAIPVVLLDMQLLEESAALNDPANDVQLDHAAYLIYTSGTTGVPKGVVVTHRSLANHNQAIIRLFALTPHDRLLQLASPAFDMALEEILPILVAGGTLALRPDVLPEAQQLGELIDAYGITILDMPTAYWHLWVDALEASQLPFPSSLRLVTPGGEAASGAAYAAFRRRAGPRVRWLNSYGPTEATISTTFFEPDPLSEEPVPPVMPIGRPIDNVQVYILDRHLQPAPIGVPGELCIGGAGVARGYLNRPDLTNERFVVVEGLSEGSCRIYRTGDRARWLPDGNVEFLGRLDDQVKIRGYRIEPGEIEATLRQHPAVRDAAVIAHEHRTGERRLAAYVVGEKGCRIDDLRSFLAERLPAYMIPAAFVIVDALPLTPNGKIDRRALPAPDWSARAAEAAFVAPRTPIEELLAGVWSDLLGVARISAQDDFFALGGHSLLATQLVARIRATLGVELPVRAVFEAPRLADLAQRVADVRRHDGHPPVPPIRPQPRDGRRFPLSFAQQRLWFLDQLEPGSAFYNIPEVVRLRGRLDVAALERALNLVARRQEALRMRIVTGDGQPALVIEPVDWIDDQPIRVWLHDLSALPLDERMSEAFHLVRDEAQRPFRLEEAPLLRATVIHLDDADHILALVMHHVIGDAWSSGILVRELTAAYTALIVGQSPDVPDLPVQYADYAVWQREWLQGETLEQRLSFWREHLSGLPPLLNLPTDRPRPAVQTYNGAHYIVTLSPLLNHNVRALAQREGATLFMTLLTAFAALLQRYSGQEEFAIGVPVAGRSHAELEEVIGFFVNTLALRMNLTGHPSFREALQRVRATALDASAYQDAPFELVVDALHPERTLSHSPIFQVMMVMQNARIPAIDLPDLTLSPIEHMGATSHFDLTLVADEYGSDLTIAFEYNTDLFDEATIARMARHFQTLLDGAIADPDQPLDRLPLLTAAERQQLLVEWNQTATPFPADRCVHDLFAAQAQRTPDAPALIFDDARLTYADLDRRANQLAHELQRRGVGPDCLVGICLERSPDLLAAMLAVLKAGGAYVPLDPSYPTERLRFMLQDARPTLVLSHTRVTALAAVDDHPLLLIDAPRPGSDDAPVTAPVSQVHPDRLAYVIYTSGSTGRPKGVAIAHRGLTNLATAYQRAFDLGAGQRVLQFFASSFDGSVADIFMALASGAALCVPGRDTVRSPDDLTRFIQAHGVTLATLPPTMLAQLDPDALPSLTTVISAGESVAPALVRRWANGRRFINAYGPTEVTVAATWYDASGLPAAAVSVPIGRPLANTQCYVLSPALQPTPIGVAGELYIGGVGVARGYLNRPALTAERFVDLEIATGGADTPVIRCRAYRSGDRVRWRADGTLEFLGRYDDQVKIRGFRVELGEVEATLRGCPQVHDAVVVVREEPPGVKRLVAYVTPAEASIADMRAWLAARLPEYMIPALFVPLAAPPLSPAGKVERRGLPPPDVNRADAADVRATPLTSVEMTLAGIWMEVLGVAQVGREDNFFALGGDSILSIQVVTRARQAGIHVKARDLFQTRTLAELAQAAAVTTGGALAEQGMVQGDVPLTPIQRWFFAQALPHPHHWNQAVLFETRAPLDRRLLETAVARLVEHHDALRLRFVCDQGVWKQTNEGFDSDAPPPEAHVEWVDLSACTLSELPAAIEAAAAHLQSSLNITRGPIARVAYFRCGTGRTDRLLIVIHHLAVDGISWRILLEDLETAYRHLAAGEPVVLPPKTTSFRAWAERLVTYASSEEVLSELDYWRAIRPSFVIPVAENRVAEANLERWARRVTAALSTGETEALLRDAPAASGAEVQDLLLTALVQTLVQWSGMRPVSVALEAHGREPLFDDLDLSRTIGWFTAIFPVQLDPGPGDDPVAMLKAIKEQVRRVPRRGIGYGVLRYLSALLPDEPLPPVSFNYLGQVDRSLAMNALVAPAREMCGHDRDPDNPRAHLIDVTAIIVDGRLETEWMYSAAFHDEQTIQRLADACIVALRTLIETVCKSDAVAYTPSDFALAGLDQRQLDRLIARIGRSKESMPR